MTLPHLAGIFTSKQLAETTREQLQAAGQPVTVHRMDLAKAPSSPVTGDDGQPVILPPGPAVCGLSGPGIPLLAVHRDLTKINYRLFSSMVNRNVWQGTGALQGIIISQVQAKKVEDL